MQYNIKEMTNDLNIINDWLQNEKITIKQKEEIQYIVTLLHLKIQSKLLAEMYKNESQICSLRQEVERKIKEEAEFFMDYEQRQQILLYKEIRDALNYSNFEKRISEFYFLDKKIQKMKEKYFGRILDKRNHAEILGRTKVYYSLICKKNPKYICYKTHGSLEPNYVMIDKVFSIFNHSSIQKILNEYFSTFTIEEDEKEIQKIRLLKFLSKHHFYVEKFYEIEQILQDLTRQFYNNDSDNRYQKCYKKYQESINKNRVTQLFYRKQIKNEKRKLNYLEKKKDEKIKLQKDITALKKQYEQICNYLKEQNWFIISENLNKKEIDEELQYIYQNQEEQRRRNLVSQSMLIYKKRFEKQKFLEKYKQYSEITTLLKNKEQEAYQIYLLFHDCENLFAVFILKVLNDIEKLSVEELKIVFGETFILENEKKLRLKFKNRINDYCENQKRKLRI